MVALTKQLNPGDEVDVWSHPVPGLWRGTIWQMQRGADMLVSYPEHLAQVTERDRRYGILGEVFIGAGISLLAGGWTIGLLLRRARLASLGG